MTLALIFWVVGLLVWFIFTREKMASDMAANAGRYAFIIGLAIYLWAMGGKPMVEVLMGR